LERVAVGREQFRKLDFRYKLSALRRDAAKYVVKPREGDCAV
jgi:hypothetical protein